MCNWIQPLHCSSFERLWPLLAAAVLAACGCEDASSAQGPDASVPQSDDAAVHGGEDNEGIDAAKPDRSPDGVTAPDANPAMRANDGGGSLDPAIPPNWPGPPLAETKWKRIGQVENCVIEQLLEPELSPALRWEPCPEGFDCEIAVPGALTSDFETFVLQTQVQESDGVSLIATSGSRRAYVIESSGRTVASFRASEHCMLHLTALWGNRFIVGVLREQAEVFELLGAILSDNLRTDATTVKSLPESPVGSPPFAVLGETYWVQTWTPLDRTISIEPESPSGFVELAKNGENGALGHGVARTTGDLFFFTRTIADPDARQVVVHSDGQGEPQVFRERPDGGVAALVYAHDHIAWLEAHDGNALDGYKHVEVWKSQWPRETPAPEFVAALPAGNFMPPGHSTAGGYGHYAFISGDMLGNVHHFTVNLSNGQLRQDDFPSGLRVLSPVGIDRKHVYRRVSKHLIMRSPRIRPAE